jgi:hypothetical protein
VIDEKVGISGSYDIYINGEFTERIKNRIMDTVLSQMVGAYKGDSLDLEIFYMALGTGNTAITNTDTTLDTEIFRTPITLQEDVTTGEIVTTFTVLDSEAVGSLEEIGIFGGSTATASADTGTLISRILWSKVKTNSEEIEFRRTDKVVRW